MLVTPLFTQYVLAEPYENSRNHQATDTDIEWGDSYVEDTEHELITQQRKNRDREEDGHSLAHSVLFYLPNRIFDVLDIVRARVKVGPGFGAGVRVTDVGELYLGSYASVFAGLPGPRQQPAIPIPAGIESRGGVKVSVLDGTVGKGV